MKRRKRNEQTGQGRVVMEVTSIRSFTVNWRVSLFAGVSFQRECTFVPRGVQWRRLSPLQHQDGPETSLPEQLCQVLCILVLLLGGWMRWRRWPERLCAKCISQNTDCGFDFLFLDAGIVSNLDICRSFHSFCVQTLSLYLCASLIASSSQIKWVDKLSWGIWNNTNIKTKQQQQRSRRRKKAQKKQKVQRKKKHTKTFYNGWMKQQVTATIINKNKYVQL